MFRKNRRRRLDVDNHIPAIVSRHDLTNALQKANVLEQPLLTNDAHQLPNLEFTTGNFIVSMAVIAYRQEPGYSLRLIAGGR